MTLTPAGFIARPRLLVRTLVATFGAIVLVLVAVFVTLSMETKARITRAALENLEEGQRAFVTLERRRQAQAVVQGQLLAENPTLKAALDTYESERRLTPAGEHVELVATVGRELEKIAQRLPLDAVVVSDIRGRVVTAAGPRRASWPSGDRVAALAGRVDPADLVVDQRGGSFRTVAVPLLLGPAPIGMLVLATAVDDGYARELSDLSRAQTAIVFGGRVVGSTLAPDVRERFAAIAGTVPREGVIDLGGEPYAVRRLFAVGEAGVYAVDSIGQTAALANREARQTLALIALGALVLGGLASLWLARTIARPIDELAQQLRVIAATRGFSRRLPPSGSSLELDELTDTFNELMGSLMAAESQTEAAYVGAIKALAAALDARDTYTAGHSERVSALSLMIGRRLGLADRDLEVLRLGALLHDIGKIGIRDRVLSKAGPLTDEEFEIIKTHPTVGAHILRQVSFLAAHLPIVEMHHEQPDGRGYPHGLVGEATPLLARVVHVADAFDAMTSARAYRPAQSVAYAMQELRRCRGSQFDAGVVDAFISAWEADQAEGSAASVAAIVSSAARQEQPALKPVVGL